MSLDRCADAYKLKSLEQLAKVAQTYKCPSRSGRVRVEGSPAGFMQGIRQLRSCMFALELRNNAANGTGKEYFVDKNLLKIARKML